MLALLTSLPRTVAITPTKSKTVDSKEVYRVCHTSTMEGIKALRETGPGRPFRFVYVSGAMAERDQTKKPGFLMGEYMLMRVRRP